MWHRKTVYNRPVPQMRAPFAACPELALDFNTLRPRQHGRHLPDDILTCIFLNENVWISIKISLKFVSKGPINNIPALVQIMAWRRPGDKPLSETMLASLLTPIWVIRPQWVNTLPKPLYVFEHKTQYVLIHAPYTPIMVFWYISNIPPMISQSQFFCNTTTFCIAAIFVKYRYTTCSYNSWANLRCSGCSPLAKKMLWNRTI